MKTRLLADGQEVELPDQRLTVLVQPGDMLLETPDILTLTPEFTVNFANSIPQEDWEKLLAHENFMRAYSALWEASPPPPVLAKGNLAQRHTVGLILKLIQCTVMGKPVHLFLPETYLHPKQAARIMSMVYVINPYLRGAGE